MRVTPLVAAAALMVLLSACATPDRQACELLDTALDEGQQFAEAWYTQAGPVLERCGAPRALERAAAGACAARRLNDATLECPP